jgi:hypothetical protein
MRAMPDSQDDRKKANLRLALILLSVVAAFAVGFVVKIVYLGR